MSDDGMKSESLQWMEEEQRGEKKQQQHKSMVMRSGESYSRKKQRKKDRLVERE